MTERWEISVQIAIGRGRVQRNRSETAKAAEFADRQQQERFAALRGVTVLVLRGRG